MKCLELIEVGTAVGHGKQHRFYSKSSEKFEGYWIEKGCDLTCGVTSRHLCVQNPDWGGKKETRDQREAWGVRDNSDGSLDWDAKNRVAESTSLRQLRTLEVFEAVTIPLHIIFLFLLNKPEPFHYILCDMVSRLLSTWSTRTPLLTSCEKCLGSHYPF